MITASDLLAPEPPMVQFSGLRMTEAMATDIESFAMERGTTYASVMRQALGLGLSEMNRKARKRKKRK